MIIKSKISYSVQKEHVSNWSYFISLLPKTARVFDKGENIFYRFYEIVAESNEISCAWDTIIRKRKIKGIYITSNTCE